MDLVAKFKIKFKNIEVWEIDNLPNKIEVKFKGQNESVLITEDEDNSYSASYPALKRDGHGGWKIEEEYSKNMLIDGVFWILKQVQKHGKVKPETID